MIQAVDSILVLVLLLNFFILGGTRLQFVVYAVAAQGILLAMIYPIAHEGVTTPLTGAVSAGHAIDMARLAVFTLVMLTLKGVLIPKLLLRAMHQADIRWGVDSFLGIVPVLLLGAVGTALAMVYSEQLPLKEPMGKLIVPSALATVLCGFLILSTRKAALSQVVGYIVLENGVFIFGLLLLQAIPIIVELGVLLDLFVGVFVMGIIIHHVTRAFPAASSEHLSTLKE